MRQIKTNRCSTELRFFRRWMNARLKLTKHLGRTRAPDGIEFTSRNSPLEIHHCSCLILIFVFGSMSWPRTTRRMPRALNMKNKRIKIKDKNVRNNFSFPTLIITLKVDIYFNFYKGQHTNYKITINRKNKKKKCFFKKYIKIKYFRYITFN